MIRCTHGAPRSSSGRRRLSAESEPANDLTIEQLAAESGMTVRNIRSHRARGLLPAPEVRDRVGYYGPEHLDPPADDPGAPVRGLQPEGDRAPARAEPRARPSSSSPSSGRSARPSRPRSRRRSPARSWPSASRHENPDATLKRAIDAGALVPVGDGRYEAPRPVAARRRRGSDPAGRPARARARGDRQGPGPLQVGRAGVREAVHGGRLEAVRGGRLSRGSLARGPERRSSSFARSRSQALMAVYQMTMSDEVDSAFGKQLERLSKKS